MNKNRFTTSNTVGIAVMLLLIGGIGAISILFSTSLAQSATLGDPIFIEKGADTFGENLALIEHNTLLLPMER